MRKATYFLLFLPMVIDSCTYDVKEPEPVPVCSTAVSFLATIKPIIDTNCALITCHGGSQSPDLRTYAEISKFSDKVKIRTSNRSMPLVGSLTSDEIQAIACWVDQGALQ